MKRTKLIASLMMCVFCLSFLVVGVWAAVTSVNFNLNGNLQFYPEGVYVELSGQVYRGSSSDSLTALTYDPRFTLEPTTNYDNSTGEPSGNFPMESWEIGAIPFIPTEKFIKIEVSITNNSDFAIAGIPDISIDDQLITEIDNITVTDNSIDLFSIESNTNAVYELILEVTSTTDINSNLSVSFDFYSAEVNYAYFTINESYQITGLTQTYIDDSPEVLVIPGYSQDGSTNLSISSSGTHMVSVLTNLTSSVVIIEEGIANISNSMFDSSMSNYIQCVVFPESLKAIGSYNYFTNVAKAYFKNPNGWSYYDPATHQRIMVSTETMANPFTTVNILKNSYVNGYGLNIIV